MSVFWYSVFLNVFLLYLVSVILYTKYNKIFKRLESRTTQVTSEVDSRTAQTDLLSSQDKATQSQLENISEKGTQASGYRIVYVPLVSKNSSNPRKSKCDNMSSSSKKYLRIEDSSEDEAEEEEVEEVELNVHPSPYEADFRVPRMVIPLIQRCRKSHVFGEDNREELADSDSENDEWSLLRDTKKSGKYMPVKFT